MEEKEIESFRKEVAKIVFNYSKLEELVHKIGPRDERLSIIKEELLKEYNRYYVEQLFDDWLS